jgi:hypothetical protein
MVSVHNGFGAGYPLGAPSYPGAIYYATRNNDDSISSTVESVTVELGGGNVQARVVERHRGFTGGIGNDAGVLAGRDGAIDGGICPRRGSQERQGHQ